MNKTRKQIIEYILGKNLIIKNIINHKNGDFTLTIGKEGHMKSTKAPAWFTDWSTNFEKKNDERWEKQETFNQKQETFNQKNDERWDKQETFNKQVIGELHEIKNRLNKIESLPTIQKELQG